MYKVAILRSENPIDYLKWVDSVEANSKISSFDVIDLSEDGWYNLIKNSSYDLFLLRPPGQLESFKRLYDERILLISKYVKTPIYPSLEEILLYENKRFLRDWLIVNNLPHPRTYIFYNQQDAYSFVDKRTTYPIVGKTNIGAAGSGITILITNEQTQDYIKTAFGKGITLKSGPKLFKGSIIKKLNKVFKYKGFVKQRLKDYSQPKENPQKGYVILQEFIPHDYEWRCVRIGDSFFAHKKIAKNSMSSGTLIKGYDPVPLSLLNFLKDITDKTRIHSVAIDIFEKEDKYLINEIQCFFGQSDPYQMLINGKPGRYRYLNNSWTFEEGMFNTNQSYDLRLEHALSLIEK